MINYLKNQLKNLPMMILICITFYGIVALADSYAIDSNQVGFNNTGTGIQSTNAQAAINEVFLHATDYNSMDTRVTALEGLIVEDAGNHNSIYRGKDVTSYLTASGDDNLFTRISSGKFTDLYVGDYFTKDITIGGNTTTVTWRIAGFDMYYGKGDSCGDGTACRVHHAVIVPDTNLTSAQMNASNTTGVTDWTLGAYAGSKMYNETLPTIETAIKNAFGSSHILKYRALLTNSINASATNRYPGTTGASSGWAWYDAYVNLMNMVQVTGNIGFSSSAFDTGVDNIQFPLFRLKPEFVNKQRSWYWLRDVSTSAYFARISTGGNSSGYGSASGSGGVRPCFYID